MLVNVDNGGTLTDVCVSDGGHVHFVKTLTTPHDLSQCLFDGLAKAARAADGAGPAGQAGDIGPAWSLVRAASLIRYSTTLGTNTLVERSGPPLGLIVSDLSLIPRVRVAAADPDLLGDLAGDRIAAVGQAAASLDEMFPAAVTALTQAGAQRLVVCLSGPGYAAAERQLRQILLAVFPRHLLGAVPVLFAHELTTDPDPIRRAWSALLNAFLHEPMETWLFRTEQRLRAGHLRRPLMIFGNDGASSRVAKVIALRTHGSGPRGGLAGTEALARHYGYRHALMLDVGGTTTDVGQVTGSGVVTRPRGVIAGVPVSLPTSEITSAGVGGSSVITVRDGRLQVGPRSVGAAPGPACFGLGGTTATITDALLLAGILDARTYLDGTLALDAGRGERVLRETVVGPLGVGLPAALEAMNGAFLGQVAAALPRGDLEPGTALIAFGGAGPLAALGVADRRGIGRVLIPHTAAVFSAYGIGFSDLGQTYEQPLDGTDDDSVESAAAGLWARADRDMAAEGIASGKWTGQLTLLWETGNDLGSVSLGVASPGRAGLGDAVRSAGMEAGGRGGGGRGAGAGPPASYALVLTVRAPVGRNLLGFAAGAGAGPGAGVLAGAGPAAGTHRSRWLRTGQILGLPPGPAEVPVHVLARLPAGSRVPGPAIVEGPYFTMPVPAGWHGQVTGNGDLEFTRQAGREEHA